MGKRTYATGILGLMIGGGLAGVLVHDRHSIWGPVIIFGCGYIGIALSVVWQRCLGDMVYWYRFRRAGRAR